MDEPRYKVRLADHEYWREQIKCQYACPVHTDARGYVRAVAAGDYEQAYLIARGPNPLALCVDASAARRAKRLAAGEPSINRFPSAPSSASFARSLEAMPATMRATNYFLT